MTITRHTEVFGLILLMMTASLIVAMVAGCDSTPRAPELVDSPVYQNDTEGFRFRVPDGWTQSANATLPPGDFEGQNILARYLVQSPEGGANLQVICFVDKDSVDLEEHHTEPSFGVRNWKLTKPSEPVDHNGTPAVRMAYTGKMNRKKMTKDVLSIRRGNRVYSFIGIFRSSDEKAQQVIERALESLTWEA